MREISKKEARDFLVQYHMINTNTVLSKKDGILHVMKRIHSIQYDPLDVVGRNIDLVMQSRIPDYARSMMNELLYVDRDLIDGWDKMMSVFRTEDYPKMDHVRKDRYQVHYQATQKYLNIDPTQMQEEVYQYLKENGPQYSSQIKIGESVKGYWGSTKLSRLALDCLYFKGDVGVKERRNTQKQFDLMEDLIGDVASMPSPFKTDEEFIEYYLLRRIQSCGLFRDKNDVHSSGPFISKKSIRKQYYKKLIEKGLIEELHIDGVKEQVYRPVIELQDDLIDKVSIIAPLDNLLWDRDLIEIVFGFRYRWEVYTPIVKREYGYYVLPLMYRSTLIGRIEFKQHRGQDRLEVINRWMEDGIVLTETMERLIQEAIDRFEQYLLR